MDAGKQKNSNMKEKSNDIKAKRKRFTINLIGILEETDERGRKGNTQRKNAWKISKLIEDLNIQIQVAPLTTIRINFHLNTVS